MPVPSVTTEAGTSRGDHHGALQEQPPRHRVQPVRGTGRGPDTGARPVRGYGSSDSPRRACRGRQAGYRSAGRVLLGGRPQSTGVRPGRRHRHAARGVQEVLRGPHGRRVVAPFRTGAPGRYGCPAIGRLGRFGAHPRVQPGSVHVHERSDLRRDSRRARQRRAADVRPSGNRAAMGRDDGAHRARRGFGRGCGPHQGAGTGRRHLAHRGRETIHHFR